MALLETDPRFCCSSGTTRPMHHVHAYVDIYVGFCQYNEDEIDGGV